jgi:hypothetical protein
VMPRCNWCTSTSARRPNVNAWRPGSRIERRRHPVLTSTSLRLTSRREEETWPSGIVTPHGAKDIC